MKIIFLDIDGVMNNTKTTERCGYNTGIESKALILLKEIVDNTSAKICLISSWKEFWFKDDKQNQDEMANYLDTRMQEYGLEIWDKTNEIQTRGKEINNFIDRLNNQGIEVERFVILDDELLDYKEENLFEDLVYTDYKIGLTKNDSQKAIHILS